MKKLQNTFVLDCNSPRQIIMYQGHAFKKCGKKYKWYSTPFYTTEKGAEEHCKWFVECNKEYKFTHINEHILFV